MNLFLSNPHGLWALLGIPAVIFIHFLQRRAKVATVSTLFLLQRTQRESTSGRRFDRLVHSIPLWLQILAVILMAWLLAQPRYIKAKSTQRIAIVLDSSASMRVFKDRIPAALQKEIPRLQGNAVNVEIWLMESDPAKPKIYQGTSPNAMLTALKNWQPSSGATSPGNALRVARSLIGAEGALSYITDTPLTTPPPYNTSTIAIGKITDNCGITGVSFEQRGENLIWKAVIRNYSDSRQSRSWRLETPAGNSPEKQLHIDAGHLTTIQGAFPTGQPRCRIVLTPDAFDLDDTLPLIRPAAKPLLIHSTLPKESAKIAEKMQTSFPSLRPVRQAADADLIITSTETTPQAQHLIVFPHDKASKRPYLTGNIIATKHPLTDGLNWQTLLARNNLSLPHQSSDVVLLWQGHRALIYLRTHPQTRNQALIFNFDIHQSNALKQPATAILLLRFCDQLRKEKIAPESRITETSEPIELSYHQEKTNPPLIFQTIQLDGTVIETSTDPAPFKAPDEPTFFTISQGDETLFTSAAYFADTREANFSHCGTDDLPATALATATDRHSRDDHLWRLWACLILATLLGAWHFTKSTPTSPTKNHHPIHKDHGQENLV